MDQTTIIILIEIAINWAGILTIVVGAIIAIFELIKDSYCSKKVSNPFKMFRQNLSKVILIGLEFLIAGDIIHSVAVSPTIESVIILSIIVVIRLLLSWELQMEIDGYWPWQRKSKTSKA